MFSLDKVGKMFRKTLGKVWIEFLIKFKKL